MKITIDYDGYWWDYTVVYGNRELMGTDRTLEGAMEGALDASDKIKEQPRNTRRNP